MKPFILENKMGKLIDITGNTYNRWTVLNFIGIKNNKAYWLCKCACGTIKEVIGSNLKNDNSISCGCYQLELATTHGKSKNGMSRIYKIWGKMKERCTNPNAINYHDYGGRGITICNSWYKFEIFENWAVSNGYSEDLTLDRKNNNIGYSPDNCVWSNKTIQNRNTRSRKGSSSKYIGVCFVINTNKWKARLTVNKKEIFLGYFDTELEAANIRENYIHKYKLAGFTLNFGNINSY